LVTGASRGIGKGITRALGEQGAIVYVTGRATGDGERTIDTTARLVTEAGGQGRAIQVDHGDDAQIEALFERVRDEAGHLDLLVNNVYKIPDPPAWGGDVSSPGGQSYHFSSSYGAGKAGLDRLTADMAQELAPKGVAALVLYPGAVSTEFIEDTAKQTGMDLSKLQTPLFVGRTAAALLAADDLMERTGSIQWVEDLADEFDLYDEHGKRPPGYPRRS
jgi:NAD(P)-dependent dehydrogenase (short-subunit alcohol dehydrogenase family)